MTLHQLDAQEVISPGLLCNLGDNETGSGCVATQAYNVQVHILCTKSKMLYI